MSAEAQVPVAPPARPTYDLEAAIDLALSEDARDRVIRMLLWHGLSVCQPMSFSSTCYWVSRTELKFGSKHLGGVVDEDLQKQKNTNILCSCLPISSSSSIGRFYNNKK
ncbi:hypothetical protein ABZP36_035161 [Zizania latifolia]